ncbi:hypothetical protein DM01DRAFT_1050540 [Hesseltinella vesiculosa]|uniref:Uncharacterized protein n=1 Tax=Hesseltinella vesiculosa TaxID=101127 RepID=A0A1X2GG44_9FUNG|nr:hypothetical protein DM01DRAFT_1050540 [Hesseltinella vesiculosa]
MLPLLLRSNEDKRNSLRCSMTSKGWLICQVCSYNIFKGVVVFSQWVVIIASKGLHGFANASGTHQWMEAHHHKKGLQPRLNYILAFGDGIIAASWIVMIWVVSEAFHVPFQAH